MNPTIFDRISIIVFVILVSPIILIGTIFGGLDYLKRVLKSIKEVYNHGNGMR